MAKKNPPIARAPKAHSEKSRRPKELMQDVRRLPKWNKWRLMPHAELWKLVALSQNIEPEYIRLSDQHRMPGRNSPRPFDEGEEFKVRLEIAIERSSELDCLEVGLGNPEDHKYTFASFSRLAERCNWKLPNSFMHTDLASPPKQIPNIDVYGQPLKHFKNSVLDGQEKPLTESERSTLYKQIAILSLVLAEKNSKYKRGTKPNASQIADAARELLEQIPEVMMYGLSKHHLRDAIAKGLQQLVEE